MLQKLICPLGHEWNSEPSKSPGNSSTPDYCPVCGKKAADGTLDLPSHASSVKPEDDAGTVVEASAMAQTLELPEHPTDGSPTIMTPSIANEPRTEFILDQTLVPPETT